MSSRLVAATACAVLGACSSSDDLVRDVDGVATMTIQLHSPTDRDVDGASYTWTLITRPPASAAEAPAAAAIGAFTPDVRGAYLVDRWMHYGASEDLTDEFAITVGGVPPSCNVAAIGSVAVGTSVALDGTLTSSPEHRDLELHWRLASRPAASTAQLADSTNPIAHLTPDVAGVYEVELDAFDGELWCAAPMRAAIQAQ